MTVGIHASLGRLKRLIAVVGVGLAALTPLLLVSAVTVTLVAVTTSADPRAAFTDAPAVPAEVAELVDWRPDADGLLRSVEPETRDAVATAWLGALAAGAPSADSAEIETWFSGPALDRAREAAESTSRAVGPEWTSHRLHVHFYSLDGRIIGLEVESRGGLPVDGTVTAVVDRYDVVLVLQDGNWRLLAVTARARTRPLLEEELGPT